MTAFIDEKFVTLLGSQLRNFKKTSRNKYRCSCPICGDSKTDKSKARGNFFIHKHKWWYNCYNNSECARPFKAFLKLQSPELYKKYLAETFSGNNAPRAIKQVTHKRPVFKKEVNLYEAIKISELHPDHPARQYINGRMIPETYYSDLWYVIKFKQWANKIVPGTFEDVTYDEPRLIIPFYNEQRELVAFQGRSFNPKSKTKYLTVKLHEHALKIYGMDRVDESKPVYILEGPIDAMFIPNAVADAGSGMSDAKSKYKNRVLVWDNEPRKKETVSKMIAAIDNGDQVCIWSNENKHNDINDAILAGRSIDSIMKEITNRTFSGLIAKATMTTWKKI